MREVELIANLFTLIRQEIRWIGRASLVAVALWSAAGLFIADYPSIVPHILGPWAVDGDPLIVQVALGFELGIGLALVLGLGSLPLLVVYEAGRLTTSVVLRDPPRLIRDIAVTVAAAGLLAFLVTVYGFAAALFVVADAILALGVLAGAYRLAGALRRSGGVPVDIPVPPQHSGIKDASDE